MTQARTDKRFALLKLPRHKSKSGRRSFRHDPKHVITKRLNFARKLRAVLYGRPETDLVPCWGDKDGRGRYRREITWAFSVREFEKLGWRYYRMLEEARTLDGAVVPVRVTSEEALGADLELLGRFEKHMRSRFEGEKKTWEGGDRAAADAWNAQLLYESILQTGTCPVCGGNVPCTPCGTPTFKEYLRRKNA